MTIKWTMMGGSWPITTYQPSVVEKISFSILETGKIVYVYVYSHFIVKNSMSSIMVLIWVLHYPHTHSLSTGQRSKGGDHYYKRWLLQQSYPPTPAYPTAISPPSPIGWYLEYSDGFDVIAPQKQHVSRNRTSQFPPPPPPDNSRRSVSLASATKPQLTYIRVVMLFTGLIDSGLWSYSGGKWYIRWTRGSLVFGERHR